MLQTATTSTSSLVEAELSVPVSFRLLADVPARTENAAVLVALHGYSQDAPSLRDVALRLVPEGAMLLSPDGPFSTFVSGSESEAARKVGFHWGVHPKAEINRAAHRAAVAAAIDWAVSRGADPSRVSLLGFSQPCAFNFRLALDPPHGHPFRAVIGICGGLPGEWLSANAAPEGTAASRKTAALLVSTNEDPFYPLPRIAPFRAALTARFASAEHRVREGGHRIPSAALDEIRDLLASVSRD